MIGVQYLPSVADRRSPEAQTLGEGPAWVFSDGEVVEGTWKRDNVFFPIEYFDADGDVIAINPGNTWVELADIDDVVGRCSRGVAGSTPHTLTQTRFHHSRTAKSKVRCDT